MIARYTSTYIVSNFVYWELIYLIFLYIYFYSFLIFQALNSCTRKSQYKHRNIHTCIYVCMCISCVCYMHLCLCMHVLACLHKYSYLTASVMVPNCWRLREKADDCMCRWWRDHAPWKFSDSTFLYRWICIRVCMYVGTYIIGIFEM